MGFVRDDKYRPWQTRKNTEGMVRKTYEKPIVVKAAELSKMTAVDHIASYVKDHVSGAS